MPIRTVGRDGWDHMSFGPGPYPRGALWQVALISLDRKLQAFAKAIPHPASARDGTCEIALQLVSHRGDKFLASGSGFVPGDNLLTESRYAGRVIEKRVRISAEGLLPPQVLLHCAVGFDHGAHYAVKGRSSLWRLNITGGSPHSAVVNRKVDDDENNARTSR
jgi:hypothetical protein